ncbi:glycosyltransferase family protein [Flavobacterium sp. 25HG05S-40]|uniref:glycosyltransferase family protein n=1 Tax=Flavobacterium sp. 25HG05S-40 TaxID=3458682 RepID=UPI004044FE02
MRILLVGEYSRLHNTLQEALIALGHEVVLLGSGDGFKNYPVDYSIEAKWCQGKLLNIPRQLIFSVFKLDVAKIEIAIRFYFHSSKLKGFDVVQLINESPIQTFKVIELSFLKKLVKNNRKLFVLSTGVDYWNVKFWFENRHERSILQPYFENPALAKEYRYILEYRSAQHQKIHDYIYENCTGVIATDVDYQIPLQHHPKFLGLIPNPINPSKLVYKELNIDSKIVIFLGINQWSYHQKGIVYFEKALTAIKEQFGDSVEIITTQNIPYQEYINLYNQSHILLDQMHGHDQGYNALEAMAKGKVVFTNASTAFEKQYNLTERVAVHALPDVEYLVKELSFLIENPSEIKAIGKRASAFVTREHDYLLIAKRYLSIWGS